MPQLEASTFSSSHLRYPTPKPKIPSVKTVPWPTPLVQTITVFTLQFQGPSGEEDAAELRELQKTKAVTREWYTDFVIAMQVVGIYGTMENKV